MDPALCTLNRNTVLLNTVLHGWDMHFMSKSKYGVMRVQKEKKSLKANINAAFTWFEELQRCRYTQNEFLLVCRIVLLCFSVAPSQFYTVALGVQPPFYAPFHLYF